MKRTIRETIANGLLIISVISLMSCVIYSYVCMTISDDYVIGVLVSLGLSVVSVELGDYMLGEEEDQ